MQGLWGFRVYRLWGSGLTGFIGLWGLGVFVGDLRSSRSFEGKGARRVSLGGF